ncbi:MAG: hypothetical protein C0404_07365 [Verrucomicrobia bacterium]|nr:hypothetical protein [Verrucomicrobiota bacterium]
MKIHILANNSLDESTLRIDDADMAGADIFLFRTSSQLTLAANLRLYASRGDATDLVANPFGWSIVSAKLRDKIWNYSHGVDFFDAPIYEKDSMRQISGYYLMHVRNIVDCLDEERSTIRYFRNGRRMGIYEYALNTEGIPADVHIFAIPDSNDVFFKDDAAQSLRGAGIRGVAFIETL